MELSPAAFIARIVEAEHPPQTCRQRYLARKPRWRFLSRSMSFGQSSSPRRATLCASAQDDREVYSTRGGLTQALKLEIAHLGIN